MKTTTGLGAITTTITTSLSSANYAFKLLELIFSSINHLITSLGHGQPFYYMAFACCVNVWRVCTVYTGST